MAVVALFIAITSFTLRVHPAERASLFEPSLPARSSLARGASDVLWLADESAEPADLRPGQAVNRVPGLALLSRKQSLTAAARALDWSFVPKSVATAAEAFALGDEPFSWVLKGGRHRNVSVLRHLPRRAALEGALAEGVLQRRVQPPLLAADGRAFDVGVYVVAVRRAGHLEYAVFDDVLLRFCREPYVAASEAVGPAAQSSWIVDDAYRALWDLPALKATPTGRGALRAIVAAATGAADDAATWAEIERAVGRTLAAVPPAPADGLTRFELLRYDFVLDGAAKPYLAEVNSNPNLQPTSDGHAELLRRVLKWVWASVTDGAAPLPGRVADGAAALGAEARATVRQLAARQLEHEAWHTGVGCAAALGAARSTVGYAAADAAGLVSPRALAWHPTKPGELWVADGASDSLVVVNADGTDKHLRDRGSYHYMDKVSSLSFDAKGQFATCQESLNAYEGRMLPNFFMGPTLYDSELPLVSSKQEACEAGETCFVLHIDMLHEAPLCMGIAHDDGASTTVGGVEYRNVYWAYDGGNGNLVRFDFESDHGPGSMDHSLASVRRFAEPRLSRVEDVPSHMAVDAGRRELYVADTGADRVLVVNVDSGVYEGSARELFPIYSSPEPSFNYSLWHGLEWRVLGAVTRPSGLAARDGIVYVGSHTSGDVHALDVASGRLLQIVSLVPSGGLGALTFDVAGVLWFAAGASVSHVEVSSACAVVGDAGGSCADGAVSSGETDVDCGGARCARCAVGLKCSEATDCASGVCTAGACATPARVEHSSNFLWEYLDSEWHTNSFMHHMAHGDMGGASYLNPYPIMEPSFCDIVGVVNGTLDCARIDFDSLLLGGCWCHPCLEDPCAGGGRCVNYEKKGYTCDCAGTGRAGDHCQLDAVSGALADPSFVWFGLDGTHEAEPEPTGTPEAEAGPPPPPAAPPPPPTMLIAHLPAASITETSTLDLALRVADDVATLLDIPRGRVVVLSAHFPADAEHAEVTFYIDSASADDAPAAAELHATLLALQRDGALNLAGAQCEELELRVAEGAAADAPPPPSLAAENAQLTAIAAVLAAVAVCLLCALAVAVTLLWNRLQRLRLLRVQTNNGAEATAKHVV